MDGGRFERLCTDLLGREGYRDIVPIGGTYDGGRDAEIRRFKGIRSTGGVVFFQYSLEENWEGKLKRELDKLRQRDQEINFYVFVTSRKVTGYKRDQLRKMVMTQYGWQLIVYDREWLRHRLEEADPDLAAKYLGVTWLVDKRSISSGIRPSVPQDQADRAWQLYLQGDYEVAAVELKRLLDRNERDALAWRALAWCQYSMFRYQEALFSISKAISLDEENDASLALKASILTEDGIQRGIKANLVLAQEIFGDIAADSEQWIDHYNYGNVLHALGEYEAAKQEFLIAVDHNPMQAEAWKNLGTVYYHLQEHEKEIDCYDKALAIDSDLTEALISKGVTLLRIRNEARKAAQLIARAIEGDDSLALRWPHAWYWLGQAYYQLDELEKALNTVNEGLKMVPHHSGLLDLKAQVLSGLWPESPGFVADAVTFYKFRLSISSQDYDSVVELVRLYCATGKQDLAWELIDSCVDIDAPSQYLALTCHSIEDVLVSLKYLPAYRRFREICTITEYAEHLRRQGIALDSDFEEAIFFVCLIPFGLASDVWASVSLEERDGVTEEVFSVVKDSLSCSFPTLSRRLIGALDVDSMDQIPDRLTQIILIWPDIALLEFSRQVGFIGSLFGLSANHLDETVVKQADGLGKWQTAIATDTLVKISRRLKAFREE
jgi:tetratricopeptide (TPR) repeat protein